MFEGIIRLKEQFYWLYLQYQRLRERLSGLLENSIDAGFLFSPTVNQNILGNEISHIVLLIFTILSNFGVCFLFYSLVLVRVLV